MKAPDDKHKSWRLSLPNMADWTMDANVDTIPLLRSETYDANYTFGFCSSKWTARELQSIEVIMTNVGAVMFVVGSWCFFPDVEKATAGAHLFISGSLAFLIASCVLFIRHQAGTWKNPILSTTAASYIVANFLFVVGSIFFEPLVIREDLDRKVDEGVALFIIGSVIFFFAPFLDLYRTYYSETLSLPARIEHMTLAICYILGSALFVIGSVLFLPAYFNDAAAPIFLAGSAFFNVGTATGLVVYIITSSWRQDLTGPLCTNTKAGARSSDNSMI